MENFDVALDHNYTVRLGPFTPSREADLCSRLNQAEPDANCENRLIEAGLHLKMIASGEIQVLHWYFRYHNALVSHRPSTAIPLDGLLRADHFLASGHFDLLEVWENDSRTDNLIVGVHIGSGGSRTYFPLYRWGSTAASLDEIRSAHAIYVHHLAEKQNGIRALRIGGLVLLTLAIAAIIDGFVHVRFFAAIVGVCLFVFACFCGVMMASTRDFMYATSRQKALDSLTEAMCMQTP